MHIHKYKRFKFPNGKKRGYRCMLPNCPHYIFEAMIVGKQSVCWRCGTTFTIDEVSGKQLKPHCNCRNAAKDKIFAQLTEQLLRQENIIRLTDREEL